MALSNIQLRFPAPGWRNRLDLFFLGLGMGVNAHSMSRQRLSQIAALEGLSDAELAARGLRRADIPAHVFADLFGGPNTA